MREARWVCGRNFNMAFAQSKVMTVFDRQSICTGNPCVQHFQNTAKPKKLKAGSKTTDMEFFGGQMGSESWDCAACVGTI